MSNIYRWHPQIKASIAGPMVNRTVLPLQQIELDASGFHCSLMALMVLGAIESDELKALSRAKKKSVVKLWNGTASHFVDIKPRQLQSVFAKHKNIQCRVVKKNRVPKTSDTLVMDGVCLVEISNGDFSHWVLAVGTGEDESDDILKSLLIIDPGIEPAPLLAWNASLSVTADRRDRHRYESALGATKVKITAVLALTPSFDELELDFELDPEEEEELQFITT